MSGIDSGRDGDIGEGLVAGVAVQAVISWGASDSAAGAGDIDIEPAIVNSQHEQVDPELVDDLASGNGQEGVHHEGDPTVSACHDRIYRHDAAMAIWVPVRLWEDETCPNSARPMPRGDRSDLMLNDQLAGGTGTGRTAI
jgi:hypothetical protein